MIPNQPTPTARIPVADIFSNEIDYLDHVIRQAVEPNGRGEIESFPLAPGIIDYLLYLKPTEEDAKANPFFSTIEEIWLTLSGDAN